MSRFIPVFKTPSLELHPPLDISEQLGNPEILDRMSVTHYWTEITEDPGRRVTHHTLWICHREACRYWPLENATHLQVSLAANLAACPNELALHVTPNDKGTNMPWLCVDIRAHASTLEIENLCPPLADYISNHFDIDDTVWAWPEITYKEYRSEV